MVSSNDLNDYIMLICNSLDNIDTIVCLFIIIIYKILKNEQKEHTIVFIHNTYIYHEMDMSDGKTLLRGTLLFAGAYLVAKGAHRVYTELFKSADDTSTKTAKDVALSTACTLSMGGLGTGLAWLVLQPRGFFQE